MDFAFPLSPQKWSSGLRSPERIISSLPCATVSPSWLDLHLLIYISSLQAHLANNVLLILILSRPLLFQASETLHELL